MGVSSDLRASDADRDDVVARLRRHALAGRLDADELEERVAAALGARTLGQLGELTRDLPLDRPPREPLPAPAVRGRGLRPFQQTHALDLPVEAAFDDALRHLVPLLQAHGYELVERAERSMLVFERREWPVWVPVVCVLLPVVGFISLLARRTLRVVLTFDPGDGDRGTLLHVHGEARRSLRRALADLHRG